MKKPTSAEAEMLRAFEVERWPINARVMRAAAVVAMVLNPIGGLTDYAIAGATSTTFTLVALRLVASAIHVPIFLACRKSQPSAKLELWIGLGFVATVIAGILGPTLLRPTSVASQGGPLLLMLVLWSLLFPGWRRHKATLFMIVSAVYVGIGFYWRGINGYGGKHELITVSIFLVALGLLLPKVYARFESTEFRLFRAQKGLERTVVQLEEEVELRREREVALRDAREEAEAASAAKGEFLANVSHELRTPLVGILGISELLLDARLKSNERERVEVLQSSGQLLLGLVNDLLDFSKLEAGR
ncbi:MAG: histidine kinase dimerization/phospho-acceptor domain-containing protein, partial [Nannocystaceae bacterium]